MSGYREDLDPDGVHADQLYDTARDKAQERGMTVAEMLAAEKAADEEEQREAEIREKGYVGDEPPEPLHPGNRP